MAVVVSNYWSSAVPVDRQHLIGRVLAPFGFQVGNDKEIDKVALDCLDETINDLNMGLFDFNRRYESSLSLTEGSNSVVVGPTYFLDSHAYLVNAEGVAQAPLPHIPWDIYQQKTLGADQSLGMPQCYSLFNVHNEGRLYLYPTPDADTASSYTLSLEYYRRIPLVSEESPLLVPREVQSALVYGGQKRLALHFHDMPMIQTYAALENEAVSKLMTMDRTKPDAVRRWRLAINTRSRRA